MTHPTNQANQAVPASQPASLPASQPASQPASLPASQPACHPAIAQKGHGKKMAGAPPRWAYRPSWVALGQ